MKDRAAVDADSGLAHSVVTSVANAHALLHGEERDVFVDSGFRRVEKREETHARHPNWSWRIAMKPGKRRALDKSTTMGVILVKQEKTKSSIRARVYHPFRVINRPFASIKVKYRGFARYRTNLMILFALSDLWMAHPSLVQSWGGMSTSAPLQSANVRVKSPCCPVQKC